MPLHLHLGSGIRATDMKFLSNSLVAALLAAVLIEASGDCSFDASPCECDLSALGGYVITCTNVTEDEVHAVFRESDRQNHHQLYLQGNFDSLPGDLLAGKRVQEILIRFYNVSPQVIDADVFRSSQDYTSMLYMHTGEPSVVDMSFLSQFSALEMLVLGGQWSSFKSIPQLPSLKELYTTSPGSQDLLKALALHQTALNKLTIYGVDMRKIAAGSFFGTTNLAQLTVLNSHVQVIEPGAFQGDFSGTAINFGFHRMDKLDERAFRDVLQSMEDADSGGSIDFLSDHSFVCDCDLYWLLITNRHLLNRVRSANCQELETGQVFSFQDYDAEKLAKCAAPSASSLPEVSLAPYLFLVSCLMLSKIAF